MILCYLTKIHTSLFMMLTPHMYTIKGLFIRYALIRTTRFTFAFCYIGYTIVLKYYFSLKTGRKIN